MYVKVSVMSWRTEHTEPEYGKGDLRLEREPRLYLKHNDGRSAPFPCPGSTLELVKAPGPWVLGRSGLIIPRQGATKMRKTKKRKREVTDGAFWPRRKKLKTWLQARLREGREKIGEWASGVEKRRGGKGEEKSECDGRV